MPVTPGRKAAAVIIHGIHLSLATGFVATLAFLAWAADFSQVHWWLSIGFLIAWTGFPYAVAVVTTRHTAEATLALALMLAVSVPVIASTIAILYSAYTGKEEAQGGHVLFVLPVYQILVWGPAALMAYWLKQWADNRKALS